MNLQTKTLEAARRAYSAGQRHALMNDNVSSKTGKPLGRRIADGRGLYLAVAPTGAMSWVFISMKNGKSTELGLGSFTGAGSNAEPLDLAAARAAADKVRVQLRDGVDLLADRTAARTAAKVDATTFADMIQATVDILKGNPEKGGWKVKHGVCGQAIEWAQSLALHAGSLLLKPIARITDADIIAVLKPIWAKIDVTAERIRDRIEKVFETAIGRGIYKGANPARYEGHIRVHVGLRPSTKGKKNKQPSLAYAKVPAAIAALLADARMAAKASVFCTLTATRTDEARLMEWSEIDWNAGLWVVPSARMKVLTANDRGGDHVVPLSDAALALLRSIVRMPGNKFVFAGTKDGQAVGATALNDMITKGRARGGLLELKGTATQHGMRASFRTWAKEQTDEAKFDKDACEMCLAHVVGDKTEQAYDRAEMLAERTRIMKAWGEFVAPSNIIALRRAA